MNALEEQADNAKARDLYWKPLSWLGTIRPTSANDAFDQAIWQTFVSTTLVLGIPVLSSLPRLHNRLIGCKKTRPRLVRRPHIYMYSSLRCNQGA